MVSELQGGPFRKSSVFQFFSCVQCLFQGEPTEQCVGIERMLSLGLPVGEGLAVGLRQPEMSNILKVHSVCTL